MTNPGYEANGQRHRVNVFLPSTSVDSRGQRTGADAIKASNIHAEITTLSGRQLEQARQVVSDATHRVKMRHPGVTLTTKHYLKFGTRTLHIGYIDDDGQQSREYTLICGEDV